MSEIDTTKPSPTNETPEQNRLAEVATLAIFLPSFIFVPLIHPLATRLRRSPWTSALLDGINIAALALMAGVLVQLGRSAFVDVLT